MTKRYAASSVLYLLFSFAVLIVSLVRPEYNWDLIGYIAAAKSFESSDARGLHSFAYEALENSVPPEKLALLVDDTGGFRTTMRRDWEAFREQLGIYRIRVAYTGATFLLYKVGVDMVFATHLISGVSVFLGLLLLLLMARNRLTELFVYTLVPLALIFGTLGVARLSTPDGLAFLGVISVAYLFLQNSLALLLIMPVLITVRTDLILFTTPIFLYLLIWSRHRRVLVLLAFAASLAILFSVNRLYDFPGWSATFSSIFSEGTPIPVSESSEPTLAVYVAGLVRGSWLAVRDKALVLYAAMTCWAVYLMLRRRGLQEARSLLRSRLAVLFGVTLFYVLTHFLLFPLALERFFVAQYLIGALVLFDMLSQEVRASWGPDPISHSGTVPPAPDGGVVHVQR